MSRDSASMEKRTSRFTIPPWVWSSLGSVILSAIARWVWKKIAPSLKKASSAVRVRTIWPVIVALALLLTVQWLRTGVNSSTLWNFPPVSSPFPHLSLYAAPLLDNLTLSWVGYLAFSIAYCARSYLRRFRWGTELGELFRSLMFVSFLLYPALVAWFSLAAEGSFLIPGWAQTPFWLIASYPLGLIVIRSGETIIEAVIGRPIFGRQGILTSLLSVFFGVGAIGMKLIGDSLSGNYRLVYSRLTSRTLEVPVKHDVRPAILSFISILTLISTTLAWKLGFSSMSDLFYVFGTVLWGLVVSSVILGWRKRRRDSEEEKSVTRVPKRFWGKFRFFLNP